MSGDVRYFAKGKINVLVDTSKCMQTTFPKSYTFVICKSICTEINKGSQFIDNSKRTQTVARLRKEKKINLLWILARHE